VSNKTVIKHMNRF